MIKRFQMVGKNATNWHMVNPRSWSKYKVWKKLLLISGWSNSQVGKEPNSKSKNSKWNIDCWRFRFVEVRELNSISCIWGRPNCSSAMLNAAVRHLFHSHSVRRENRRVLQKICLVTLTISVSLFNPSWACLGTEGRLIGTEASQAT